MLGGPKGQVLVAIFWHKSKHEAETDTPKFIKILQLCLIKLANIYHGCRREGITRVPHFTFYKGMEKIHEEEGVGPEMLAGDVLYYGDHHQGVVQLHSKEEAQALVAEHKGTDGKLIVLDVGLKYCEPCVKVYPTVVKLSKSMADFVVFARMNGDENESCIEFLKEMGVVEVPTFLFIREGKICGRYVGSGKGELVGEILRYQGVRVTY